jgi:hypothetical protein
LIDALYMPQKHLHPGQNVPGLKAGKTATPATGEMLPEVLKCRAIDIEQGNMTMACPTNQMLRRTDMLTGRYLGIATLKQMTPETLKPRSAWSISQCVDAGWRFEVLRQHSELLSESDGGERYFYADSYGRATVQNPPERPGCFQY